MSSPTVVSFLYDETNEAEFAGHGLTAESVDQVLDSLIMRFANRRTQRAPYYLVGKDHGGRFITIPVEPTFEPGIWRPITAWLSKGSEVTQYNQARGIK